jgi:hypothetical protein
VTALREQLGLLPVALALLVLAWNVSLAGWIAARREGPQWFARLTGLAGLLVAPAAVIAVAASTDAGARTITGVAWLWPATCLLLVLQALAATGLRYVSASVGVPIACYNALLAAVALGDDLVARSGTAPLLLQGGVAARDTVLGIVMGRAALTTPLALLVPLLAPAYPARWRASALVRALLVLYAAVTSTLLAVEWPRGVAVVQSYAAATQSVEPRDPTRFALGVRTLPVLDGAPAARAVRAAARLDERLAPDAVLAVVRSAGMTGRDLDSLARVLAPSRAAGRRVLVALEFSHDDAVAVRREGPAGRQRRLETLARVLERLRPDVIVPVLRPLTPALRGAPWPATAWWQDYLRDAANEVARVRPATSVAWIATRFDVTDSAVYAWAARAPSPVTALGFAPVPSFSGLPSLDARLRAADRWQQAAASTRPHWILTAGLPRAHGDVAQREAIRHVIAWASTRPWVAGVIAGEPSDDDALLGLVGANGRERAAVDMLARLR